MFRLKKRYPIGQFDYRRLLLPGIILICVLIGGTMGYYLLWFNLPEADLIDAFYMTFITITTVGFGEIHKLGTAGRLFTIVISVLGIGSLFYSLTVIMENLVLIQINNYRGKKKMYQNIESLKNHVVLVGFGRVGQLAAKEMLLNKEPFVVIDDDFAEEDIANIKDNILKVRGDATEDATLIEAGIERARGLIVATANPATTVFVTLSARVLNPKIFIVARSEEQLNIEKLKRAGADKIVNPYSIGGQRLANLMINPHIVDFFETNLGSPEKKLNIENYIIPEKSHWNDKSIQELEIRQKSGATILGVIRENEPFMNPAGNFKVRSGDHLVVLGTREQLKHLFQHNHNV